MFKCDDYMLPTLHLIKSLHKQAARRVHSALIRVINVYFVDYLLYIITNVLVINYRPCYKLYYLDSGTLLLLSLIVYLIIRDLIIDY